MTDDEGEFVTETFDGLATLEVATDPEKIGSTVVAILGGT